MPNTPRPASRRPGHRPRAVRSGNALRGPLSSLGLTTTRWAGRTNVEDRGDARAMARADGATPRIPSPIVLEAVGLTVHYGPQLALDAVDLRLRAGEVHAVLGENGAGKSTLVSALAGVHAPSAGSITVDGAPMKGGSAASAIAAGVSTVYQDHQLCINLTVGENIMLGREVRGRVGINWRRTHLAAQHALAELDIDDVRADSRTDALSPAMRQLVAIARATVSRPRVLILDEPTSSLDHAEVAALFRVIRRLTANGVAVLFISHFLEQAFDISDRMTILRDGRRVSETLTGELERPEVVARMLGKDLRDLRLLRSTRLAHRVEPVGPPAFRATSVGRRGAFAPTDLDLHAGEIVGFAGLRGSGRSEYLRILGGLERRDSGDIRVAEMPVLNTPGSSGWERGIALMSADRFTEGMIDRLTARENLIIGVQARRGWHSKLSKTECAALVTGMAESLRIPADVLDRPIGELSGGMQQRVLLARYLATHPRVLLLDEPTKGLDVETRLDFHFRIAAMAAAGTSVVFVSAEFEELIRLCDRIAIFKDRAKVGEVSNGPSLTVDSIVEIIAEG